MGSSPARVTELKIEVAVHRHARRHAGGRYEEDGQLRRRQGGYLLRKARGLYGALNPAQPSGQPERPLRQKGDGIDGPDGPEAQHGLAEERPVKV